MFTFIIAALAGLATPFAEPHIKTALESLMLDDLRVDENEFRAFSFAIMMVLAAILAALGGGGSALGLAVGGLVGLFGKRIFDAIRSKGAKT
jgi:hypothetical protein